MSKNTCKILSFSILLLSLLAYSCKPNCSSLDNFYKNKTLNEVSNRNDGSIALMSANICPYCINKNIQNLRKENSNIKIRIALIGISSKNAKEKEAIYGKNVNIISIENSEILKDCGKTDRASYVKKILVSNTGSKVLSPPDSTGSAPMTVADQVRWALSPR